ncbi:putative methyltransferases-like [Heracleum sosnowskyi]|uniref:Methyltransferases-like n=1 Tax=Heracleum sosnowskyi TaxID=360622 RepID=A0AAD8M100_9APIA|nr:putative methyltransferases-like [Heracleum sosnowskyi]
MRHTGITAGTKPNYVRTTLTRIFMFCLIFIALRFAYFCFISTLDSSSPSISTVHSPPSKPKHSDQAIKFYTTLFKDLISDGYLSRNSKSLCLDTPSGDDVLALKNIGVWNSIGVFKKSSKPLVISGQGIKQPFNDDSFSFIFSGINTLDLSNNQSLFANEVGRTLKPQGHFVLLTFSIDTYSFNSFIELFDCCTFMRSRQVKGYSGLGFVREIVMKKESDFVRRELIRESVGKVSEDNVCAVPGYKKETVRKAEPLIMEEPLKPWITLKTNIKNVKYLSSVADINFKRRYVYVDVGARSYGSSIASWFKKQYPKQNKTFEIYAIEADKIFYDEYKYKKGVTLVPYAAWIRNESLFFEINQDPGGHKNLVKGRGMGRIKPVQSATSSVAEVDKIQGFDFANWLKSTVSEKDFVVMKMDVEGTEFDLIPRLFETGAICLIDEIFLECHYNRWQRCCPGERSPKYEKTYGQCLDLFTSLRKSGVLVHQWW